MKKGFDPPPQSEISIVFEVLRDVCCESCCPAGRPQIAVANAEYGVLDEGISGPLWSRAQRYSYDTTDYDKEGLKVFERLNLEAKTKRLTHNHLDAIWSRPGGKGKVYVGNRTASSDANLLKKCGVRAIVNCTHEPNLIPNVLDKRHFEYLNFPICEWEFELDESDEAVLDWFRPVFSLVDKVTRKGDSVLIHCLAGAHRAGTTGVSKPNPDLPLQSSRRTYNIHMYSLQQNTFRSRASCISRTWTSRRPPLLPRHADP